MAPPAAGAAHLYTQYCASCHQEDGKGVPGTFPPLQGSELVNSGQQALIGKVLKGSSGSRVINGVKYDMTMPAFSFLKDEQIADILTYVRKLGTNRADAVDVKMVMEARTSVK